MSGPYQDHHLVSKHELQNLDDIDLRKLCLVSGVLCLVSGVWCLMSGVWFNVPVFGNLQSVQMQLLVSGHSLDCELHCSSSVHFSQTFLPSAASLSYESANYRPGKMLKNPKLYNSIL